MTTKDHKKTLMKPKTLALTLLSSIALIWSPQAKTLAQIEPNLPTAVCVQESMIATYWTENYIIYICNNGDRFRYLAVNQENSKFAISLPAIATDDGYEAINGKVRYHINKNRLSMLNGGLVFSNEAVTKSHFYDYTSFNFSQPQSNFSQSQSNYQQQGILVTKDPYSTINVRSSPSTQASIVNQTVPGERVNIISNVYGNDGYTWYQVQLGYGMKGWIRGDLVRI